MSLPPVIFRDIGDEVPAAERIIYQAYIDALLYPSATTPERAIIRAAQRCGVSRQRVLEVVRTANVEALPHHLWFAALDSDPSVV